MARTVVLLLAFFAFAVAGCGGDDDDEAAPPAETEAPAQGDPEAGADVFASAGCGSCHTLADAGTTGTIGVNLDERQPSHEEVVQAVTTGPGAMPDFSDQLSDEEIQNVAAYVSQAAGG